MIYRLIPEEPLKYHISGDPVKDGFRLKVGQSIRIVGEVLPFLKVAKIKGNGRANYRLEKE